jgi:AcrR family transcriptional regulator
MYDVHVAHLKMIDYNINLYSCTKLIMARTAQQPRVDRRAINAARTRIAILEAAMEMAEECPLNDVHVEEIADRAGVSRMTFFNHFGQKDALWFFFAWTWWLRGTVALAQDPIRGLAAIRRTFADVAESHGGRRRFFLEFVSFVARMTDLEPLRSAMKVTPQERRLLHPGVSDVEELRILTTAQQFRQHLEEAVEDGELESGANYDNLIVDLGGILYGGILMSHMASQDELMPIYERQLGHLLRFNQGG